MGVGIFAARKIALLNSINNLELMMTQLSSQQMRLADKAMNISMQQNNIQLAMAQSGPQQNVWGALTQGLSALGSGVGGIMGGSQNGQYASNVGGAIGGGIGAIGAALSGNGGGANPMMAQQVALDNQLLQLQQQEKRLQLTMKQMETQLSMKNKEYESVEKAEEKAIQRATPKFNGE